MTDLIDRYVGAILGSIPGRQRADIEAELRASIGDAIDARVGDGDDPTAAEKSVLTDLGDPARLAADYTGRPGHLIGPGLFFDYRRLLIVLMVTVVPIVMTVIAVLSIIAGEDAGTVIGDTIGIGVALVVHMAFWTTLVFAIIERTGERSPTSQWTLSYLPPVTATGEVKLGETIATVAALVFAITVLTLSRTYSPVSTDGGEAVPIFDPSMWDFWFPYFIVILALEILFELVKYRMGRWTWGLASVNLALNAAFAGPAVYLLLTEQLFNPVFFEELGFDLDISGRGPLVIGCVVVIAAAALWDTVDGFRRALRVR